MAKNIFLKLALTTASVALSFAALEANRVQAATITYDFTVSLTAGSLAGTQGSGFFSFDDSTPSSPGQFPLTDFSLSLDRTYTLADAQPRPNPTAVFQGDVFLGIFFDGFGQVLDPVPVGGPRGIVDFIGNEYKIVPAIGIPPVPIEEIPFEEIRRQYQSRVVSGAFSRGPDLFSFLGSLTYTLREPPSACH